MQVQATELTRFERDSEYFEAHRDELLARYPETWIAIFNGAVVGIAPDIEELLSTLRHKGVAPEHALVKHLTCHEDELILPS